MNFGDYAAGFLIGLAVGVVGFGGLGFGLASSRLTDYKQEAIERGYAQHDPKTGEWRWIEPVK